MDKTNNTPSLFSISTLNVDHKQKNLLQINELNLPYNQLIVIIGANGAGKSTLIHALLGQINGCKVTGNILCQSLPIQKSINSGKVAWVGQHEKYEVPLTVLDYCLLGTMPNLAWYQQPSKQAVDIAKQYLADFDLIHLANMRIHTLSGGEKQRMAMVRALMQQTDILLLDEPTNHLDIKHQRKLFGYLRSLVYKSNKSIIMVLHSLTDAHKYADYVVALSKGEVLATGKPDEVMTANNLKTMYEVEIKTYTTDNGKIFV